MIETPRLLINLKTYLESSGDNALRIAKAAEDTWKETNILIGIAPNIIDLRTVALDVEIPVYAQHTDPVGVGAHTGHIPPALVKAIGGSGSLINHSERQVSLHHISEVVKMLRDLDLSSIVCAPTPEEAAAVSALNPSAVAIEPPELIGTGVSVSKAKPEVIVNSLKAVIDVNPDVDLVCGAGISNKDDVRAAIKLGSYGVLVASAIAKSPDPYKKIRELIEPFIDITRA